MNSAQTRKVIAAGMIGNVLEWYDFAIYGYFASAIGRQFFPHENPVAQLLSAFGVFALGYLMRPVGGALVGHIGDRFGRRGALTFSVTAMAIPTFLIGVLPGYSTLGLLAPAALILLRMVQGLSVGGEYTSSMVFLVEHAPKGRRGLMGALAASGAGVGTLLGSAMGAGFAASMSAALLEAWGWRIPFLLGLLIGIAGYFLRRHILDTTPMELRKRVPIVETLQDHWRLVLAFAGLSVFNAVGFYVGFVYLVSWLQTADGIPPARALEINSFSMTIILAVVIAAGCLSDRFGRKPLLLVPVILGFVGAVPLFWLMNNPSDLLAQLGQLGLALIVGLYGGTQPAVLVEAAPPQVRCTAVALGYNICFGVIGGSTPLAATWLVERTGDEIAPALNELPANNISELMTLLRANPGKYSYASSGVGTSLQVLGEMINVEGKVHMVHVPYRAAPQIVTDLLSNQIDLAVLPLNLALPPYRNGNVKIFGTSENTRSPLAPDLLSLADHPELKNVNMTVWYGLFAPAKTDPAIVDRIYQALATTLHDPSMRAKLAEVYLLNAVGSTPSELAVFLSQEIERYSVIVKAANIKAE